MATTLTPQLQLNLPEVGASRDTWGALLNQNFTDLDEFVSMAMPIGAILDFAGPNAPAGWLICDGRQVSRVTYSALFAVIGAYWGAGDGSTTFNLPNTQGRMGIGPGTVIDQGGFTATFGFTGQAGYVVNQIQQANLPNYPMSTDQQGLHAHGGSVSANGYHQHTMDQQGQHNHTGATDWQDLHSHNVQMPVGISGGVAAGAYAGWLSTGLQWVQTDPQGWHAHNISADGLHVHNIWPVGDHTHTITNDGLHAHSIWLGGSGYGFAVQNPYIVVTKIIYAGMQASPYIVGAVLAPSALETADELVAIRQELAELRALFAPPRPRQIAAPMRGTH